MYTDHLNTNLFEVRISNGFVFKWSVYVLCSNGQFMCHVLCTRPIVQITDQYIRKQDGVHSSSIEMAFEYPAIWHPTSIWITNSIVISIYCVVIPCRVHRRTVRVEQPLAWCLSSWRRGCREVCSPSWSTSATTTGSKPAEGRRRGPAQNQIDLLIFTWLLNRLLYWC